MQTFNEYLFDIFSQEDMTAKSSEFSSWLRILFNDTDTLMQYADDYAKECIRLDHERISKAIKNHMKFTETETDSDASNWIYEECLEVLEQ